MPTRPFTMRHCVGFIRAVLLKDASFGELQRQLVALAVIGLTVFTPSAALLRRRLA